MDLRPIPLLAILAANPCAQDPTPQLEARVQELLETTVEKPVFWAEVERRGLAAKALREREQELAALEAERATLDARLAQLEEGLFEGRETNARATQVLEEVRARRDGELREVRARERTLEGWAESLPADGSGA